MGRNPVNLPSDEFRCTAIIDDKHGGRCSRPRLPAITLCRIHHLLHLQLQQPTTTTNPTAAAVAAQSKKRGRPPKNKHTFPSDTAPEQQQQQQPSNDALTLPSDRCTENDGKDRHDCRGPATKLKHHSTLQQPTTMPLSPPTTVKNVGHPCPPPPVMQATLEVGDLQLDCCCTTTIERCPRPRLPGTTLCRHHHPQHLLIPSTTNPLTTAAAQPNKRDPHHPTTTTTITPPEQPNNNIAPALPPDRCTRNDGRGWRCSYPCLPGNVYCDKHDQYYRRKVLRSKPIQRRSSSSSAAAPATTLPGIGLVVEEVSQSMPLPPTFTGTQAEKQSVVKPTVPPGYMQGLPKRPPPFKTPGVTMEAEALELASPTMQVEKKKPSVVNVNHPKPPPKIFRVGRVWALPAASGGPPRAYARINRIIQRSKKAEVSLLAPHPVTDEEIGWVKDGRTLACGTFRTVSHPKVIKITSLSHQIAYSYSEAGKSFNILPKAGEVWAVYDELETGATHHLAEIVSGFTQDRGVTAARLVLVEGGVFKRELRGRYELRRTFLRRDLLWFSHRVLAVRMAEDAAGCGGLWKVFS